MQPWTPALDTAPQRLLALAGRWWWMGREFQAELGAAGTDLVIRPLANPDAPAWRFRPQTADEWRGYTGENDGELLRVLRDRTGTVVGLDIATFVFTRDPDRIIP